MFYISFLEGIGGHIGTASHPMLIPCKSTRDMIWNCNVGEAEFLPPKNTPFFLNQKAREMLFTPLRVDCTHAAPPQWGKCPLGQFQLQKTSKGAPAVWGHGPNLNTAPMTLVYDVTIRFLLQQNDCKFPR